MSAQHLSPVQLNLLPQALRPEVSRYWDSFVEATPELAQRLLGDTHRLDDLLRVWSLSEFVAQACIRHPEMLLDLLTGSDLDRPIEGGRLRADLSAELSAAGEQPQLERVLRVRRRREMVRIAWRDLSGVASIEETLEGLTLLAETLIQAALDTLYRWQAGVHGPPVGEDGAPQALTVLGMGKLGGRELNYSSDIDLMFAYPGAGGTDGRRPLSSEEFFLRLGQKLIRTLNQPTADGFVYRVDMRLRPFGESGPLVMPVSAMEHYYQTHGREWERYALIKARPVAGDLDQGDELLERLRPFVYRRYLDYGSIESLRGMKTMISREMERKGLRRNVKLGPGGIREIEFIAQVFQLIHGGRRPRLRQRGLISVLGELHRDGDLPEDAVSDLREAYFFLRRVENRLQAFADRQTHELPESEIGKVRLASAMGCESWRDFVAKLGMHVQRVERQFSHLFSATESDEDAPEGGADLTAVWYGEADERARDLLQECGYGNPGEILEHIGRLREGFAVRSLTGSGRQRLNRLMPLLLGAAGRATNPDRTLERLMRLVETVARRSNYLALLVENPLARSQLVRLCSVSPWISEYLRKHPLLLDELLTPATLYEPLKARALERELRDLMERVAGEDLDHQMDMLRHFQQINILRVAAAEITGGMGLMVVSDCLTWIAEAVLSKALEIAWGDLRTRYGEPTCEVDGASVRPGFAIVAYGKLGGIELGYGSDLDLVFLHDSRGSKQHTDGSRQLDNATFFARLGQRIIHMLTTRTAAGVLYEVDTRLRPSGRSGLLVSSVEAFTDYQRSHAWTWEHQALVRARFVAGTPSIGAQFDAVREQVLCTARDRDVLRAEVCDMRSRMREQLGSTDAEHFHLKQGRGGIADIEFMVQYEVLASAWDRPSLATWSDNVRQLDELYAAGVLDADEAELLRNAYRKLRQLAHRRTLEGESDLYPEAALSDELRALREGVTALWRERMQGVRADGDLAS